MGEPEKNLKIVGKKINEKNKYKNRDRYPKRQMGADGKSAGQNRRRFTPTKVRLLLCP